MSKTIPVPSELLRTLINAADEGASARSRDAAQAAEQGDDEEARTDEETKLEYDDAVRNALELERAPSCNTELVAEMMDANPIAQLIIVEAIRKYATACAKADPKTFDNPMLSGAAWVKAAQAIVTRMDAFYNRHNTPEA